ncbi:MAG: gliding motility-associated protein GldE [Saprospiraceae bacterium]
MESEPDPTLGLLLFFPLLAFPTSGIILAIIFVFVLLICSAFISSSEVAYFSLTPNDLKHLENENTANSNKVLILKEKPRKLLATILIFNNFINIGIVILSDYILRELLPSTVCQNWAANLINLFGLQDYISTEVLADGINFTIAVAGVTFLLVLFGEVAPKVYAKINNIRLATFISPVMQMLVRIFSPMSNVMVRGTNLIEKKLDKYTQSNLTTQEEIDEAIELTLANDENEETDQETDILKSIVKFGNVSVKQIMRSRVDVIAVDFRLNYAELLKLVRQSGFSRLPVFDEDFDNVMGILYVKDLLEHLDMDEDFEWQALIRTDLLYVPEAKKINDLLKEFQLERLHMAIVVDEYGGSSGIVTLEDILEEVIGEIKDEFDAEAEVEFKKIDNFNYIFEGKTLLNDFCRVVGIETGSFDEVKGDSDSLAGLMLEVLGEIPEKGAEVSYNEYQFKIVSVNSRRIKQIKICLPKVLDKDKV